MATLNRARAVRPRIAALVVVLLMLWYAPSLSANEAFVETAGGTVGLRDPRETTVELIAQTIRLYLRSTHYYADISFVFRNDGPTTRHELGFPRFGYGAPAEPFGDFRTWVNDQPVWVDELPDRTGIDPRIRSWFVKQVEFPAGKLTATRVRFRAAYGRDRLLRTVEYLYGTGRSWSGPIGAITVQVHNEAELWVDSYTFAGDLDSVLISIGKRDFEIQTEAVEPDHDDVFRLGLEPVPWWLRTTPSEGDMWAFEYLELKPDYLRLLTLEQLRLLRNTFFARRGFDFCDGPLGDFFRRFGWYHPRTTRSEGLLGPVARENVRRIVAEEERRRTVIIPPAR
ncbi:MAG: YARHG domain-containing protein [Spirochaetaceae bacterium]|nr:MAG: YARHG domain-containing protein [Spirochaetaceae bacterium]